MTCAFCAVVSGETDAHVVVETPEAVGFLDRRPLIKGHVLVVPREHIETFTDLPAPLIDPVFTLVQRVAVAVRSGLGAQGSFTAVNTTVSQSVPHLHVHVVPRTAGDGLRGFFWPRHAYGDGEAQEYAARLRAALEAGLG